MTKSENLHLYPLFIPYEDPGEIPYDDIAWERGIHPNKLRGMIRAARNNSTIYEALIELGWRDEQIPWWFARPKQKESRRRVRKSADYSVKSMPPQITQTTEEPEIRTKIVPETLPVRVEPRAPLTPGPLMYLPLNLNERKRLVPYRDGVNDHLGLYTLKYVDQDPPVEPPYLREQEMPQFTREQWKIWLKIWYDTKKFTLEQEQAARDNLIYNLQIYALWEAGNKAIRREQSEKNMQVIEEPSKGIPTQEEEIVNIFKSIADVISNSSNAEYIQKEIAELKKSREKEKLKMYENLASIAEIRRRNRAEKFRRLGIEDPLKVSPRNRGYLTYI
jgi:hypothetical protein